MYEGTRPANTNDVVSIEQLLRPLEENGVLVHRSREQVSFIITSHFGENSSLMTVALFYVFSLLIYVWKQAYSLVSTFNYLYLMHRRDLNICTEVLKTFQRFN